MREAARRPARAARLLVVHRRHRDTGVDPGEDCGAAAQSLAVTEHHSELFEIGLGQIGEHGVVDGGLDEHFPVLTEAEPLMSLYDRMHPDRHSHPRNYHRALNR